MTSPSALPIERAVAMDGGTQARRSAALGWRRGRGVAASGGAVRAADRAARSDRAGSSFRADAAGLDAWRRRELSARHRQPRSLRAFASDFLVADRGVGGVHRGIAGGSDRHRAGSGRGQLRRLDRSTDVAPDRRLDGVSADPALDRAGGRDRRRIDLRHSCHRGRRLDAVCPDRPGRDHGAASARLCDGGTRDRHEPGPDLAPGDRAQPCSAHRHAAGGRDGCRDPGRGHPVVCRYLGCRRHPRPGVG